MFARTLAIGCAVAAGLGSADASAATLTGKALSGTQPVARAPVKLSATTGTRPPVTLGTATSRADGSFTISYEPPSSPASVLYVTAGRVAAVLPRGGASAVVNERTTVAAGFALAQFVTRDGIAGPVPGPQNAAGMAANLANARNGDAGAVLARAPNGRDTSTWRTFNSLANLLVPCVRSEARCAQLFRLARPPRGPTPAGTLEAIADIARNPSHNVRALFSLAASSPAPYRPARSVAPAAWTLALRFVGDGQSMSGPGNMAIDADGNVWVTNNYVYSRNRLRPVCGSNLLLRFTPSGRYVKGSPYSGGGLAGAGFGITLDPDGNVWVGNFGFAAPKCPLQPKHDSVSKFDRAGKQLSPPRGFRQGPISWPQGTVSDRDGNVWIANCGNDTVTRYAKGDPRAFRAIGDLGILKPFDIAFSARGQAFVTGVGNDRVAVLNPDGAPARTSPITHGGLNKPMGIAADSRGNMWIANSGLVDVPCPDAEIDTTSVGGSLTLLRAEGAAGRGTPFTGGGLTVPWGVAVDGNDNVWVANFAGKRLSQFCGMRPENCPPGTHTGDAISPRFTGYGFDGLVRNTGVQIDPSGNVWVANNWKTIPIQANPGGYEMVAFVGLAGPLRTPLIGPPRPLMP